ncbi:aldo/keto reductase [Lutimonas zeaxanthinifaciens]|uniref:aldo/keto reductase n=1 Tax=Lutimonas zeaxanthinifaciens TaxID=3060215 RepID=UPI00265D2835|nr:aldo/keto reductase [Lutimonas sp. YSD2104]WKK67163.1 aldo/keto reductase [Lutimonas sp. YSD2104]
MKYNTYIKGGIPVSEIGLGAWQLGSSSDWKSMSEKEAIKMVLQSMDYGINFFDTAPNYGFGTSEIRLGKAFKGRDRDKFVINTKFGHTVEGRTNFRSDSIRDSLEGSLKRLDVDYVDSLIIHNPPFDVLDGNKNDHYEVLEKLMDQGKIKAYGASLDNSMEMDLFMRTTNCSVIEAFFNILHQDTANAFEMAQHKEVAIIAKIPLDSGWLSGKYDEKSSFDDIRQRWSREDIGTRAKLVKEIKQIIGKDRDLAQTAIAFCLSYPAISTVIPGNATMDQLRSNVESTQKPISTELVVKLQDFYKREIMDMNLPW